MLSLIPRRALTITAFALSLCAAHPAYAQRMAKHKSDDVEQPTMKRTATDTGNRAGRRIGVGAIAGLDLLTPTHGVEVFTLLNRNTTLGFSLTQGIFTSHIPGDDERIDLEMHARTWTGMLEGRYYLSKSFYLKTGVGYRDFSAETEGARTATNATDDERRAAHEDGPVSSSSVRARSILAGAGLGNIWTFRNGFYIGAEWFGMYLPVRRHYERSNGAARLTADDQTRFEEQTDQAAEIAGGGGTAHLAMLNMGMVF